MEVTAANVRCRPFERRDLDAVREVIRDSFPEEIDRHPEVLQEYPEEAYYQPENLIVAEVAGRVVSHMGLRDGELWLSGRPFPAALVGTVCTLSQYRGRGIGGRMLRYSFEVLRGWGMALSYLHTLPARYNFYRRLGYCDADHEQTDLSVDLDGFDQEFLDGAARLPEPVRRRPAAPADVSIMTALYRQVAARGTGAWSRNPLFWRRRLQGRAKLWLTASPHFELAVGDRPLAYVATIRREKEWQILEVAWHSGAEFAVRALVAGVLASAKQAGLSRVRVTLPRWLAVEELLALFAGSLEHERETVFVRLHDVNRFLALATPLLKERAESADLSFDLTVTGTPSKRVRLGKGERKLALVLPPGHLASLFYNGESLPRLLQTEGIKIRPAEKDSYELLGLLFPPTQAGRFPVDGY